MEQLIRTAIAVATWGIALGGGTILLTRNWTTARKPVKDPLFRAPGESCRRLLEDLTDKIMLRLFLFILVPVFAAQIIATATTLGWFTFWTLVIAGLTAAPLFWHLEHYRRLHLGWEGERAVGELLNHLMLDGYRVFHDYPAGPNWNIDHIVVGPSGVYSIETKTKRKKRRTDGRPDHTITFDGKSLYFPGWTSTRELEQARNNANGLGDQLSKALAEPIHVQGILTFPGWWIERTGRCDVYVVNAKELRGCIVTDRGPQLSSKQIKQICARLEEKCRDVEF